MTVGSISKMVESLSLADLENVKRKIEARIEFEARQNRKKALETLHRKATELGYDLKDLVKDELRDSSAVIDTARKAKYVHPDDPNLTWSGRGRQPHWFKSLVRSGVNPESLLTSTSP